MDEEAILAELGTVMDRLAELPSDAFAERFPLTERRDELRKMLAVAQQEAGRDADQAWAEQSARKRPDTGKPFHAPVLPDETAGGAI